MTKSELIVGLMATALGTTMSAADTLTVPSEFPTIQAAIFAASDGDTIAVQPGEYSESIFVGGVELEILAVGGPGSAIIDSANAGPCVSINGVGSAGTVLDGFVVRNGASRTLGGGLLIAGVDGVSIRNCTFQTNHSDEDGGGAGVAADATASFTDCIFEGNTAANDGGGLCILANGGFTVERCRFVDNTAGGDGGGAQVGATGTLEEDESPPRIINSVFTGNSAEVSGGGAFIISAGLSCPTFLCYVGGAYGCTFSWNTAEFGGGVDGGAAFVGAPLSVVNCILHGNSGDYPLYDNGDFEVVFTPAFLNCNVDFEGDADPRFVSELGADGVPGTGDELLQLLPGSPCIDAGYVYAGGSTVLNGELDISGRIRRIDSVFTADTGTTEGPLPIVDIGAYEFEDEDVDGTIAVWTGAGGAFDAPSNWFGGVEPEVGIATWLDGPDAPETETTLRGNITIGQLFVNSGDWSMVGTNRSSVRSVSVGREGDMGKEPGSIFVGSYAGDRSSFSMTNLNLFCESLVLGRGDFEIGPSDDGGSVSISAVGSVVIATDDDTRLPSEFRGEGSVTTIPVGTLPSFWNLGVTQPTGLLGITGNYYQSGGILFPDTLGRLRFDLADPDQSLAVTGTARLGGPVEFEFDPLDPPKIEVGETFEIVTATDGFDGTTFSLARTSGIGGGLFLTLQTNDSLGGTGSSVVATVNSAEELLLGDSENEATDAVADAIVVDLDGVDGPDLVLSVPNTADPTGSTGSLVILLNQGVTGSSWDGFEAYGSAIAISVGRNPAGLDAGDIDGDGDIDLAVANRSDGTVSILENDGTGTSFTKTDVDSQPNLAGNADPLDVYIGDLDGDGDADLAVTNGADGSVVAFANQTSPFGGGFGGVDGGTESDPGSKITTFDPGQADGKDRDDRVKGASSGGNSVKSSSTALSAGGGIVLTWETNSVGSSPVDIAVGLLDGDGLPDVATADEVGGTISILLNDPSPSETYFPAITVSIGDSPISIDIGDLDGDGDSDIGVICEDAAGDRVLRVVQNMLVESGQFALSVLATDSLVGQEPFLLRIRNVDVDASGIGDVVALTGNSALTGDPADGFGALLGLGKSVPCVGDINLDGIVNAADLGLLIGAWGNKGGAADLNGDGLVTAADLGLLIGGWGPCPDGLGD